VPGRPLQAVVPDMIKTLPNASLAQPSRAWLTVGLLWGAAFLNYLDRVTITTMRASLVEAIPMSDAEFGLLTSVFLWVYALASPAAGWIADRFSLTRVIVGSLLAWSLATWLTGRAQSYGQLLATRALMGITEAFYLPAALALIARYHRGGTRSLANGVHLTGVTAGAGLGGLGGWLAEAEGWRYAFVLFGLAGLGYALVLLVFLREAPVESEDIPHEPADGGGSLAAVLGVLFGNPSFRSLAVFWGLLSVAGWGVVGWMPSYLGEHFQLSQGKAGLSATAFLNGAIFCGLMLGGSWADHRQRRHPRGRIHVAVTGLLIATPGIWLSATSDSLVPAIAGLMIYGLARSFSDANLMPILCQVVDARHRATGMGVLNFFATSVGGLTIYAGGMLRDASVNVSLIFLVAAACILVCAWLLARVRGISP